MMTQSRMSAATARATLGVKPSATAEELYKAWEKKLAQTPDAFRHEIQEAYAVLNEQPAFREKLANPALPVYERFLRIQQAVKTDINLIILKDGVIRITDTDITLSGAEFSDPRTRKNIENLYEGLVKFKAEKTPVEPSPKTDEADETPKKKDWPLLQTAASTAFTHSGKLPPYRLRDTFGKFHEESKHIADALFGNADMGFITAGISTAIAYAAAPTGMAFMPSATLAVGTGIMAGLSMHTIGARITPVALAACTTTGALAGNMLGRVFCAATRYGVKKQDASFNMTASDAKAPSPQSRLVGKATMVGAITGAAITAGIIFNECHYASNNAMLSLMDKPASNSSIVWRAGRTIYDFGKGFIQPKLS